MNEFYVYEWIRLDTNEPFYVGKGKGRRWCTTKRDNTYFNNIVNEVPVAVFILESNLDEKTAFEYEIFYINKYKDMGFNLTNIQDGGEHPPVLKGENNPMYGRKRTKEEKEKISKTRAERGLGRGGDNPKAKKVLCLETGELFNCVLDAQISKGIKTYSSLTIALCENEQEDRTAGGFHWAFEKDVNEDCFVYLCKRIANSNTRKVYYVDIVERKVYIKSKLIKELKISERQFKKNKYDTNRYVKVKDYLVLLSSDR